MWLEVRGVRLNAKSARVRDAEALRSLLKDMALRIGRFGWHIEIYAELALVGELVATIRDAPVPVVLDHMGGARVGDTTDTLRPLLDLLANGQCWLKLTGALTGVPAGNGLRRCHSDRKSARQSEPGPSGLGDRLAAHVRSRRNTSDRCASDRIPQRGP